MYKFGLNILLVVIVLFAPTYANAALFSSCPSDGVFPGGEVNDAKSCCTLAADYDTSASSTFQKMTCCSMGENGYDDSQSKSDSLINICPCDSHQKHSNTHYQIQKIDESIKRVKHPQNDYGPFYHLLTDFGASKDLDLFLSPSVNQIAPPNDLLKQKCSFLL